MNQKKKHALTVALLSLNFTPLYAASVKIFLSPSLLTGLLLICIGVILYIKDKNKKDYKRKYKRG